ncbi:dihydrolipoyl dehydrogenase [Candidatus Protochlamydia phocaeensis]|uniref:dihydrolipoyl dehydrogenase n=1 Tax=Candidatus Protochlamydia phocaeensis TaxID=1414722 RepID=UPI0008382013|nr:dihydrolipoyl dehydrogenase [Candidatus Protochlamydia phocaeensis]
MAKHYELAIIGAGPGGYVAAIRAAQLGFKTVCIDKRETLGGTCLNVGCIPSKALLQSTELLARVQRNGKELGIDCSDLRYSFRQMMDRKKHVVKSLVDGIAGLFKKNQVDFIQGEAEFINPHLLKVKKGEQTEEIEADSIILATGSEPIALPFLPFDERQIVSSTGALSLPQVPERLVVIGGGVIGVELASVYSRLGASVTVVEMLDHICPAMDKTLSKQLLQVLQKQGIQFHLSTKVATAVVQPDEVILTIEGNEELRNLSAQVVLVAVGRRPYSSGLGLEKIGIQPDRRGFVPVDANLRTAHSHIFAIGDLIDGSMLAHRASEEGVAVVEWLKGGQPLINYMAIPNVIYTDPEVAAVGMTEQDAREAGLAVLVGTSFFKGNPRARCSDETEGLVKIVGDQQSGRLVGMHIIGAHASELIAEGMMAMQKRATLKEIGEAPNAHPTLSEAIKEAALHALGRPIHL